VDQARDQACLSEGARITPRSVLLRLLPAALLAAGFMACGGASDPPAAPVAAVCGNGIPEPGEECDDGNAGNSDACLVTCQAPVHWTASDVHVHSVGCSASVSPENLAERLHAQQIQVGAALVWGEGYSEDSARFTGRDHPVSGTGFILHYDLEVSHFPAARTGHLILLGLDSLSFSDDVFGVPQSGVPIVDWARAQRRAVVGMAHGQFWPSDGTFPVPPGGCCVPWEAVIHAARGRLDFLSMERTPADEPGTFRLWKSLQNAGLRVAIAGGSDWSCISERFDEMTMRSDVLVDGALTYENWLSAIRAGRSAAAVGIGNHLNLRVEGKRLGEDLQLAEPRNVTLTLEKAGQPMEVEVLMNGEVVTRVATAAGDQVAQAQVPVVKSSWISARSRYVLTSPVYAIVRGQAVRPSPEDACYLQRYVEHLQELVATGRYRLWASEAEALRAYEEARSELQRRFSESGGQVCR
jgi:cysteine-rich repeat protein